MSSFYEGQFNTLRPRWNGQHFADDTFKRIFFNEDVWISIKISLTFVPKGPIYNIPALVQVMAWRRPGDKPLSEPMMDSLPTHICVTRPQCGKRFHATTWVCHRCTVARRLCPTVMPVPESILEDDWRIFCIWKLCLSPLVILLSVHASISRVIATQSPFGCNNTWTWWNLSAIVL